MSTRFVTQYTVLPDGISLDDPESFHKLVTVEWRGTDRWAVKRMSTVLNSDGEWEYEVQPSSRDDDFKARCRFGREVALKLAGAWADQGTISLDSGDSA